MNQGAHQYFVPGQEIIVEGFSIEVRRMKEIFSAFGSEIFRPLATIVIPGAMAISTWFVVLVQRFPSFRNLVEANHTETTLLLVLASIASGLFVEDIGSRIESRVLDKKLSE